MGARYYDSTSRRFLSPDPVSYPTCLDLYTYANGNPINFTDPNGRFASAVYQTVNTTFADTLSCIQSGYSDYSKGYAAGKTFDFSSSNNIMCININATFCQFVGEQFGKMDTALKPIEQLLFPERPPGRAICELPLPNNVLKSINTVSSISRSTTVNTISVEGIELNRFHQSALNLTETGQNNIRVLRGWAKSKGWTKKPNSGGPEVWGVTKDNEFEWRLKIKPEGSLRPNLEAESNVPRFSARLDLTGTRYINAFTGEIGNKSIGGHIPLDKSYY